MVWLLRSPFSGLLDGSAMLLTFRGRRSGTEYTLPVQYAENGDAIWVWPGHHERKTWWRNLLDESRVGLRLRGAAVLATGQAFCGPNDTAVVEEALVTYIDRFPAAGRRSGVVGKNGLVDEECLRELAKDTVMVRIVPAEAHAVRPENREAVERAPSKGLRGAMRRHPLGSFYTLTFLFSWAYWVPDALSGGHLSHAPGLLGPMVAAFVVTGVTQGRGGVRDLVARMARWRVPLRWYAWALAPIAVAVAAAAVASLGPDGFPNLSRWARMDGLPIAGVWGAVGLILLVNCYGEEAGWRGFALPRFRRRHNELRASFLLFIPWALWHLPTFFLDTGYRDFPLVLLPGFLLGMFAGAVVLTWMYEGGRSSILVVALWHLSLNIGSATKAGEGAPSVAVTMLVIVWSIFIARAWRRREETHRVTEHLDSRARIDEGPRARGGRAA